MVQIRTAQESDTDEIISLREVCGLEHPNNDSLASIRLKLHFQKDLFLVAELQGAVVGTVMAGYEGHRGWINYLAVHPDSRRTGIGRDLMGAAEQKLRDLCCPKINLQVRETNTQVIQFYEQLGYAIEPRISMGKS